jgi:hypothetical protein
MPYFTLHRTFVLRTTKGHTVSFAKGQPAWVPPMCVPDVVAIGAVAVEEGAGDILGDEAAPVSSLSADERQQKLFAAFETMLNRSERNDFTASGLPHARRLTGMVGFDVGNRERDDAWQQYTQSKAEAETA